MARGHDAAAGNARGVATGLCRLRPAPRTRLRLRNWLVGRRSSEALPDGGLGAATLTREGVSERGTSGRSTLIELRFEGTRALDRDWFLVPSHEDPDEVAGLVRRVVTGADAEPRHADRYLLGPGDASWLAPERSWHPLGLSGGGGGPTIMAQAVTNRGTTAGVVVGDGSLEGGERWLAPSIDEANEVEREVRSALGLSPTEPWGGRPAGVDDAGRGSRMWIAVRTDAGLGSASLAALAGEALQLLTVEAMEGERAEFRAYVSGPMRKEVVGVAGAAGIAAVVEAAHAAGLPVVAVPAAGPERLVAAFGPGLRSALPTSLARLPPLDDGGQGL